MTPFRQTLLKWLPIIAFYKLNATVHRLNPLSHLPEDFYLSHDIDTVIDLLWPLPSMSFFTQMKAKIDERINATMQRHIVRVYFSRITIITSSQTISSMLHSYLHGNELWRTHPLRITPIPDFGQQQGKSQHLLPFESPHGNLQHFIHRLLNLIHTGAHTIYPPRVSVDTDTNSSDDENTEFTHFRQGTQPLPSLFWTF